MCCQREPETPRTEAVNRARTEGVITCKFGTYDGQLNENIPNGVGTFTYGNGDSYKGDWVGGKKNGHGDYLWASGCKYNGAFRDDQMDGDGVHTWPDTSVFHGRWRAGKLHGEGVLTTRKGVQYEEVWEAGKRVSRKEKKTAEFDDGVYEGGLKHGLPYGKGL